MPENRLPLPSPMRLLAAACACVALAAPNAARAVDLLQSYQAALEQDASYAASRAVAEAEREALPQARSQLLPNISINGYRYKTDLQSSVPGPLGPVSNQIDYTSSDTTLGIKQPLFRKYQWAAYGQAKARVQAANTALDKDRQELGVRVAGAYLDALLAQDQLSLLQAQKAAYAGQLAAAKRAFQAGAGTRTDIDDAQARFDMTAAQELEASQNIEITLRTLESIINQPVTSLAALDPARLDLAPPAPAKLEDWIARGEAANPELASLKAQSEAARQEVEKARAGHYPTVDLYAQRARSQSQTVTTVNSRYLSNQFGIQFSIPLYAGGYVDSSMRQARANVEKVTQQHEATRRNLGVQIRREFEGVTQGVAKVRALEQALRSTEQALYSTQKGIQAGTRSQIDLLNAQQQKVNAMRDLAQGRYLYVMARIRLLGLTGALNEDEIRQLNRWFSGPAAAFSARN